MYVIRHAMKYYKKVMPLFILISLFSFGNMLLSLFIPQVNQLLIDRIIYPVLGNEVEVQTSKFAFILNGISETDYTGMLIRTLLVMGSCLLLIYTNHYAHWNISHAFNRKVSDEMRSDAFKKFLSCSPRVIHGYTSGDMMTILNNDVMSVMDLFQHRIIFLFQCFATCIGATVLMMTVNFYMAIVPAVLSIATFVLSYSFNRKMHACYTEIRDTNADLNSCIQENINGVRIIRSFASEDAEMTKFEKKNISFRDNYIKLSKTSAKYHLFFRFIGHAMSIASMIVGVVLAVRGDITVGQFTTFSTYVGILNSNVITLAGQVSTIQNSLVSGKRLFSFLDSDDGIDHSKENLPVPEKPNYTIENVTMNFNGVDVLSNVNISIPYGKKIGLMGKTGCGKSVIMRLLNRFYDCTDGKILIDGHEIGEYDLENVRRTISFVSQDVFLFSETVSNNIAFYDEGTDEEKIKHYADIAQVTNFANSLESGFDTIVGERGLGLSGGQKQRVSIARALYKNAPVLLLDDCTSALDYSTEKEIINAIDKNYGDKTLIIASNRATSVSMCDEIIYMEDGKIIERGSHNELMSLKGRYYNIYVSQTSNADGEVS